TAANVAAPTGKDWIGLYPSPGATDSAFVAWRYTGGGGSGSAPLTIPAGTAAGTSYELRLFANDGYTRLARSGPIAVTAASLSASPASVAAGASTTLAWSG